jgi:hypothetical protein
MERERERERETTEKENNRGARLVFWPNSDLIFFLLKP